jgi:hypothetical protein
MYKTKYTIVENGKILKHNNTHYKILSVQSSGIVIEEYINDVPVKTTIPWNRVV